MELGRVGIWSRVPRPEAALSEDRLFANEVLREIGLRALWIPGGAGGVILETIGQVLEATPPTLQLLTGVLNVWMHSPQEVGTAFQAMDQRHPGRFVVGLGASHQHVVERIGAEYSRPLAALATYLDEVEEWVPKDRRLIAALGPKMHDLARRKSLGVHPYLVTPQHTAVSRDLLGAGPLLAPQQKV